MGGRGGANSMLAKHRKAEWGKRFVPKGAGPRHRVGRTSNEHGGREQGARIMIAWLSAAG